MRVPSPSVRPALVLVLVGLLAASGRARADEAIPADPPVLRGDDLYVRAVVTSSRTRADPAWEGQRRQAWTQPVGWTLASAAAR